MKNTIILLLTLIFSIQSSNAQVKEYFADNGQLVSVGALDGNNSKIGVWKFYYKNGQLSKTGAYEKSKRNNNWIVYYKNGQVNKRGKYDYGEEIGKWEYFYDNGKIQMIKNFDKKGIANGEAKFYRRNGQLKIIGDNKR